MSLSWNEIKSRAIAFSKEWEGEKSENAEAKSFWDGFFTGFWMTRRRLRVFELKWRKRGGTVVLSTYFGQEFLLLSTNLVAVVWKKPIPKQ